MRARLVTGYVPLKDHPRSAETYGELGEKLGGVPVRKKCFYTPLEACWLWQYMHRYYKMSGAPFTVSHGDNSAKNTLAYHCVQHQKALWLNQAAIEYPDDDVFVWVDYGIFHQPGINNQAIYEFMERVQDDAIYAPGCWDRGVVEAAQVNWRFCGSVLAVPRKMTEHFAQGVARTATKHITSTNNVEWEVNTWARMENDLAKARQPKIKFHWYKADHDVSQFTNLPHKEVPNADQ